jgi:hypothetical protein
VRYYAPRNSHDNAAERFWAKVEMGDGPDACWLWTAYTEYDHGRFCHEGKRVWAHRLSWEWANGPVPPGLSVLHTCHVGRCVNPSHLYVGTQADNVRDRVESGRQPTAARGYDYWPRGDAHPNTKLTEADVVAMKRDWATGQFSKMELSRRYNCSHKTVRQIIKGETWGWLTV